MSSINKSSYNTRNVSAIGIHRSHYAHDSDVNR